MRLLRTLRLLYPTMTSAWTVRDDGVSICHYDDYHYGVHYILEPRGNICWVFNRLDGLNVSHAVTMGFDQNDCEQRVLYMIEEALDGAAPAFEQSLLVR